MPRFTAVCCPWPRSSRRSSSSASARPTFDLAEPAFRLAFARACDLARSFTDLVRDRRGQLLFGWIRQAEQSGLILVGKLATFLPQDLDAVTAGLTLEWSSGIVERYVNRLKTIKRAMHGRASSRLLRIRVLTRPRSSRASDPRFTERRARAGREGASRPRSARSRAGASGLNGMGRPTDGPPIHIPVSDLPSRPYSGQPSPAPPARDE